jgi:hypothetical protein
MTSGAQAGDSQFVEVSEGRLRVSHQFWGLLFAPPPPGCSFQLSDVLGDEVNGGRDDSWRGCFVVSLLGD